MLLVKMHTCLRKAILKLSRALDHSLSVARILSVLSKRLLFFYVEEHWRQSWKDKLAGSIYALTVFKLLNIAISNGPQKSTTGQAIMKNIIKRKLSHRSASFCKTQNFPAVTIKFFISVFHDKDLSWQTVKPADCSCSLTEEP